MKTQNNHFKLPPGLVPDYIQNLVVYQAGRPIEEVARERGLTRISKLASNENPLGPSPYAIREMTQALWNLHRYPDMHAFALKSKLAEHFNLKRENIILGNGSEGIMGYIARAFLRPGDEVLTSEKSFIGLNILAQSTGAILKKVPLTEDYSFDYKELAQSISPKTKLIYIANPNNPTGTFLRKNEFDFLMDHVPDHVLVLLDEAYFEYAKEHPEYPDSMHYRYDNVLTLRTFSKAYGLAGIRVGYGFGHEDLIGALLKVKLPFEPNLIAQAGAVGALEDQPHLQRTIELNKRMLKRGEALLTRWHFKPLPSAANFLCFRTGSAKASDAFVEYLLTKGVIVRSLKVNEMPEYVRISMGTEKEMDHLEEAMNEIMPKFLKESP